MIRAAIAGGTGFTAGETLGILLNHPDVEVVSVLTTSSAGIPVSSVHKNLIGETNLKFTETPDRPDVVFLCLGHGHSREFLDTQSIAKECKVIDLGNDFRLERRYGEREFIYGLADLNREKIKKACNVANPGCFATAIQNATVPLAMAGILKDEVHVTAITGSTGSGKKPSETNSYSWRSDNISIYKLFTHQHLGEIKLTLDELTGGNSPQVNFVPMRGCFARGIFASVYTRYCGTNGSEDEELEKIKTIYRDFYKDSPFTFVCDGDISMKDVVNTNKSLLHVEIHNGYIHIASVIDNLVKGAAGQAVENMNLMFGLPETEGLKLKASAY